MNQLNSLIIEGNVCRDAEVKETANGFSLATFPIAVNRYHKKADGSYEQEVSYFDIEAWGELAKAVKENTSKGSGVRIVGRLKQNRWTDQNGKNQAKISVIAEHIDFLAKAEKKEETTDEKIETVPKLNTGFDKTQLFSNPSAEELSKASGFDIF